MSFSLLSQGQTPYNFKDVNELVDLLNLHMNKEGFQFDIGDTELEGDFVRVYVGRGGGGVSGTHSLFLDLRVGLPSPRGKTIEMAGSKPGSYAIPGFARHVYGQKEVSPTFETFQDYVRSVFEYADSEKKTPGQAKWIVYQKGWEGRGMPGAEEVDYETPLVPKAGGVLGKSSSGGKRSYMASVVRYFVPEEVDTREYIRETTKDLGSGGGPFGLIGYGPEGDKGSMWVPLARRARKITVPGMGEQQIELFEPRTPEGVFKSTTLRMDARELADVPFYKDPKTGRLEKITPSLPRATGGFREGWTRSSVVMPGETEGRVVFSRPLALLDQPDMPGSILVGKDAYKFFDEALGKEVETAAIGESGSMLYELGVKSTAELLNLVKKQKLVIGDVEGKVMQAGKDMYQIGHYMMPDAEYERQLKLYEEARAERKAAALEVEEWNRKIKSGEIQGEPRRFRSEKYPVPEKPRKRVPLLTEQHGYDVRLGKPTLHIPQYYISGTEGEVWSNLPQENAEGQATRTDALVEELRKMFGDRMNIVQSSAIGTGGVSDVEKEDPAAAYLTYDIERLTNISMKGLGLKAFAEQKAYDFKYRIFGRPGKVKADLTTQEGKIPARILMASFGVMDLDTQTKFLDLFLPEDKNKPKQKEAKQHIIDYVKKRYADTSQPVQIRVESMARIWEDVTGSEVDADMLFAMMFRNVTNYRKHATEKQLGDLYGQFRIGFMMEQMAEGRVYGTQGKETMEALLAELGPEASGLIRFERFMPDLENIEDPELAFQIDKIMREQLNQNARAELWRMYYKVPASEGNLMLQGAVSHVPEYQSSSGFLNSKAIMSLLENYPRLSYEMGIRNSIGNWSGVFSEHIYGRSGRPERIASTTQSMLGYLQLQGEMFTGSVAIPKDVITLNEHLGGKIKEILKGSEKLSDEERLKYVETELAKVEAEQYQLDRRVDLSKSWFLDTNSMTLVPPISEISGAETYEGGVLQGKTRSHFGNLFLGLLESAANSSQAGVGEQMNLIGAARYNFYNKVNQMFYPYGKRSKQMFRHVTGAVLPGTRGGRYQGMTELEKGFAFASDDYIRKALSNRGFKNRGEVDSIMRYLNRNPEAYLPILSQRYPDVSGITTWMPLKLRSAKHLATFGIPVPEGALASDLFFMSTYVNRFQVGDFDADPYQIKIAPIQQVKDPNTGKMLDLWSMTDEGGKEFHNQFDMFYSSGDTVGEYLEMMFGKAGVSVAAQGKTFDERLNLASESWDVQRKNLADWVKTVSRGGSTLLKRLEETGTYHWKDVLNVFRLGSIFQAGKGISYITRTETMDIPLAVLGAKDRSLDIFRKAYERYTLSYNSYLDLKKIMAGGFTALETMMNTYGTYGVQTSPQGTTSYRLSYMESEQMNAPEVVIGPTGDVQKVSGEDPNWENIGYAYTQPSGILQGLMTEIAGMGKEFMSNEMLAWGFSQPGMDKKVLGWLNDPVSYWKHVGYSEETIRDWRKSTTTSRAGLLANMLKNNYVGANSPYYLALTYRNIERLSRKQPEALMNKDVKLPWVNGRMMSVGDIMSTDEYRIFGLAENLFVRGKEAPLMADLQLLSKMGGPRMLGMLAGIYKNVMTATGGVADADMAEKEFGERLEYINKLYGLEKGTMKPVIHASEIGAMLAPSEEIKAKGWREAGRWQAGEAILGLQLRTLGFPKLMSYREKVGTYFQRKGTVVAGEDIGPGIDYEESYRLRHPEKGYIGSLKGKDAERYGIRYTIPGTRLELHGQPDFVDYDQGDYFEVRDTKSPASKVDEGIPYTEEFAREAVGKYRYRMQLIAYAYGIEQMARPVDEGGLTEQKWLETMEAWGITDRNKALNMRSAAARGRFKLWLQPGRKGFQDPVTGEEKPDFEPVEVSYGSSEKGELQRLAKTIEDKYLNVEALGKRAWEVYGILQRPLAERALPSMLDPRYWERTLRSPRMRMFEGLKAVARGLGFGMRAAGGGRFGKIRGTRMRVGEGGPEDIVVGPDGITVIPTSDLPETRDALGYLGARLDSGGTLPNPNPIPGSEFGAYDFGEDDEPDTTAQEESTPEEENVQHANPNNLLANQPAGQTELPEDIRKTIIATTEYMGKTLEKLGLGGYRFQPAVKDAAAARGQIKAGLLGFRALQEQFVEYEAMAKTGVSSVLQKHGLVERGEEVYAAGGGTADVIAMALSQNVPVESFQEEFAKTPELVQRASKMKGISAIYGRLTKAIFGPQFGGDIEKIKAAFAGNPEVAELLEDFIASRAEGEETQRGVIDQGAPTASFISDIAQGIKDESKIRTGLVRPVDPKFVEEYEQQLHKVSTTLAEANKLQQTGNATQETWNKTTEENLRLKVYEAQLTERALKVQSGAPYTKDWARMSEEEELKRGYIPSTKQEMILQQVAKAEAASGAASKRLQKFLETGEVTPEEGEGTGFRVDKLAMLGRRLLGGFGLMYMQSIAGVIGGKAMEGYAESQQMSMLAQQQLGGVAGGFAPYEGIEARIARAQRTTGGLGGYAIRGAYASILENPTLATLLGLGQAGLGAASFGLFAGASLFESSAAIAATGGAAAALAIPTVLGIGIAGAYNYPEQTAASLYAQSAQGKGNALSWATLGRGWEYLITKGAPAARGEGIEETYKQMQRISEYQTSYPGITFQEIKEGQRWSREDYERYIKAYSESLAKTYITQPEYTYQAIRLQQLYRAPLTPEVGGGIERLAALLEQGIPVQQLATAAAWSPYASGKQQYQRAGQFIEELTRGGWSEERLAYMQAGAGFLQSMGIMAPYKPGTTTVEVEPYIKTSEEQYGYWSGTGGNARWITGTRTKREMMPGGTQEVSAQAAYEEEVGRTLSDAQKALILRMTAVEQGKRERGQAYISGEDVIKQVGGMNQQQMDMQVRMTRFDELMGRTLDRLTDTFQQIGVVLPNLDKLQQYGITSVAQLGVVQGAVSLGAGIEQQLLRGGTAPRFAERTAQTIAGIGVLAPGLLPRLEGVAGGDRREMVAMMMKYPEFAQMAISNNLTMTGVGGTEIPISALQFAAGVTGPGGQLTGLPWGRTNLATFNMTGQQVANMIWGPQSGWAGKGYSSDIINQMITGGTRQVEIAQARLGFEYQQAQAGLQFEQIALQKWYMPQQFALQARGRQLSYAQQEWAFGQQEQQLALSQENFAFQTGMQQRQMGLQRQWTREDWAYQGQVRGLQWQWRQEDYAENLRFMTGRERRLAERQMGRETTLHDLESEQIEKQKGRQKELWAMEDERFNQQVAYQNQLFKMQEENLAKQREFFEQNKQLQEESAALQEEYWKRSIALQEKAAGITAGYAAKQQELYETMLPFNNLIEDINGILSLINTESGADLLGLMTNLDPSFQKYRDFIQWLIDQSNGLPGDGGGDGEDGDWAYYCSEHKFGTNSRTAWIAHYQSQHKGEAIPEAFGGRVQPGMTYLVGERGMEIFQPDVSGVIKPRDPWGTTYTTDYVGAGGRDSEKLIHLTVFIGDEKLIDRVVQEVDQKVRE